MTLCVFLKFVVSIIICIISVFCNLYHYWPLPDLYSGSVPVFSQYNGISFKKPSVLRDHYFLIMGMKK